MVRLKQPKRRAPRAPAVGQRRDKKASGAVDYEALAQFRYRLRIFLEFADANARNVGLTSQQYQALLTIKGLSGQTPMFVGELARFLLIKHHTAVELVGRMVRLGLLRRTVDASDNRRVLVTLTKKGDLLLRKVAAVNFKQLGSSSLTLSRISRLFGQQRT
jgi:DNA-binding MarR family transcriptional regulator